MMASSVSGSTGTLQGGIAQAGNIPHDSSRATIRAAVYAGLIAAALSTIPLGQNFILALPFAGFLSVLFYRRWVHDSEPRTATGFKLVALTGVFAFVAFLVISAIETLTAHGQSELRQAMLQAIQQQQARAADPQIRQMFDYFTTPQGMAMMIVLGFAFMGVLFVLLSGVGAAISASLLRRKSPPQQ